MQKSTSTKLTVETLEGREMLTAVTMTDYEQLILEMVNRARMDPAGEVARNPDVSSLNQGLAAGTISATPKQPLASVQELVDAGEVHALDMLANNYFSHYSQNGDTPTERANALGYVGSVGENIAWNGSTGPIVDLDEVILAHNELFKSPTHRENLMWDAYEEAGLAAEFGQYTSGSNTFNAVMVAQEFGYNSGDNYLTGVAYSDDVIDDDFYSVGESELGISITADDGSGGVYTTTTGASGGYNVKIPSGTYTVTASGGSLTTDWVVTGVVMGSDNIKLDFNTSDAPTGPPIEIDIVGINSSDEIWAGISDGSSLTSGVWANLPSANYRHIGVGDFNNDGFDDVASRNTDTGKLVVGISTEGSGGSRSFVTSEWGKFSTVTGWTDILVGDFNNDGNDDILGRADSDGTFWLAESDGSSLTNAYWGKLNNSFTWNDLSVGDFNGDGNDDTMARAADGTWWGSISNGSGLTNSYWGRWSTTVTWSDVNVGDFNGDGLDDIAGRYENKNWRVNRSNGTTFQINYWGTWTPTVAWEDVTVGDFDGDGDDDIAGRGNGNWWIAISSGTGFSNSKWGYWTTATTWSDVKMIDLSGDGKDDLIGRAGNGTWWVFESTGTNFSGSNVGSWSTAVSWDFVSVGNFA